MNRAEIEKTLHDELERARLLYDAAANDFRTATKGMIPTDPDYPDRTAAIRTAGGERRSALHAYSRALKRFTDFIVYSMNCCFSSAHSGSSDSGIALARRLPPGNPPGVEPNASAQQPAKAIVPALVGTIPPFQGVRMTKRV
jgi:hypothetical protein